jgi:uncharacterized protein (DUF1778 family)
MEERKQLSLYISEEDLKLIDKASKLDRRSRNSFIIISAQTRAVDILNGNIQNNQKDLSNKTK